MNEAQIKHMVNRFLGWRLPEDFSPDAGISFKPEYNENTPWPGRHEPIGTNLLNASQAEAMVRHMIEGLADEVECPRPVDYYLNNKKLTSETGMTTAEALFERAGVTPQTHSLWRETRFDEDVQVKPGVVMLEPEATFYTAPNYINAG